jgi:hypothetical protein
MNKFSSPEFKKDPKLNRVDSDFKFSQTHSLFLEEWFST